ncbi:MAG TPA: transglutaminase-like domain-containing protein, partial [Pseudonocardiaceae bacterium]
MRSFVPARAALVDAAFLLVLGTLALAGFRSTYDGATFLLVGVAALVLGILVGHVAVVLRQPMITVAVLTVAVFFLLGGTLVLGSPPTVGALRGLADASVHGWKELLTTLPPVAGDGPLLVIPYILGLLCGAGGFTLARRVRRSAAPLVAPVAVLVAVILLGTPEPGARLTQGVVFGCVALCWAAARDARSRSSVRSGAGVLVRLGTGTALLAVTAAVAAFGGPYLSGGADRYVLREHITPPIDLGEYPSPLVGFRKYTKDANQLWDQPLFRVTGLPDGAVMRIATLDDYTGAVWAAGSPDAVRDNSFQRVGETVRQDVTGRAVTLKVTVEAAYAASDDVNAWLPTAGAVTGLEFEGERARRNADGFRYNLATRCGVVRDRLAAGDTYTLRAVLDPVELPESAQPFGHPTLRGDAHSFLAGKALAWAGDGADAAARLRAVATHLRENGAYSSGGPGETQFLPGHGVGRLTAFVNARRPVGDDEQYAAAFALVANNLGVPARVVLGATPGPGGVVRGQDVHPFVEVHLSDGRWAAVPHTEFTPDVSKKPDATPPQVIENTDASVVPPPNTVRIPDSLTDSTQVDGTGRSGEPAPAAAAGLPGWLVAAVTWGGPPVLLVALVV